MDFDDLLLHPLKLFREHPDRLRAYQAKFSFILVDEFQDTNRAQYELIRLLGAHGNVCVVGDDDQSIYGWRGADVRNMQDFLKDFPGARLVRLEENYRSTQVVLDAANGVIAENSGRIGKTLTTRRRGGESVTLLAAADERDEAEWVVRELERRSAAGDWGYADMAVLYRTNSQSRALEEAFRRAGIPYRLIGAISFYERREVKDLLAYLRLLTNPADDEAFLRAVAVPRRGLGETSLATLQRTAAHWSKPLLATARAAEGITDLRPNVREAFRGFAAFIDGLAQRAAPLPPADVLEQVIRAIDYEAVLHAEGPEGEDRWENVRELVASAANWSEVVTEGPTARRSSGSWPKRRCCRPPTPSWATRTGVTLMTLHTAKGLEWPVVVLTGLENGLFPLARAEEQPDGLEEERRLCYVGLTRAKDKLYLTWARARRRGGELRPGCRPGFSARCPRRSGRAADDVALGASLGQGGRADGRTVRRSDGRAASSPACIDRPTVRPSDRPPEELSQDTPRYVKGERVRHRRFGSGTIQGLTGTGRDLKVSVAFDDEEVGVKQLLVAYRGPRARMGERMSIGRDEVLHVARLAELAVKDEDLNRLVDQLNRIVDYVAQLDRVPADGAADPFLPGPAAGRAARGRARLGAAGTSTGRAWRPSSPMASSSCRATARWRTCERGRASPRTPARGWPPPRRAASTPRSIGPQALLDAEARRVDASPAGPLRAMPIAHQGQHRHHRRADHLRLAHPRGLRLALRRHRGRPGSGRRAR